MCRIVGFYIEQNLSASQSHIAANVSGQILNHFPWLNRASKAVGETKLTVWGHGDIAKGIHQGTEGRILASIGPTASCINWPDITDQLDHTERIETFQLPWEGRAILIAIDEDSGQWTMWNDWNGSIPVFHAQIGEGRIASTVEPIVVQAAQFTPEHFFIPGLLSLLINGHYLGEWSLFTGMKIVPPDSVATWCERGFQWRRLWTIRPTDENWHKNPRALVDDMYELSYQAIVRVLDAERAWTLPLSGGLDSRLIAAVGSEIGVDFQTYTYGHELWVETIYAKKIAEVLELPWQRIPIEPDYLAAYTHTWLTWFGSALHCHGMYQMPFLSCLQNQPTRPMLQGYMGDPLAGNHLLELLATHVDDQRLNPIMINGVHWSIQEIGGLISPKYLKDGLDAINAQMTAEVDQISGADFQRLMVLDFWNRQRLFIYYQPMMYDYYQGVATPFLNRPYAQFCMSLPRAALEERTLQKQMLRQHFPKVATTAGTFGKPPLLTPSYVMRKSIAAVLPRQFRKGALREFAPEGNTIQINALREFGKEALWPLDNINPALQEWFDLDVLEDTVQKAAIGNEQAYHKLRPLQAIAWHFVS